MTLDFIALVLLGIFVFLGWRSGALQQCVRVVAIIVVLMFGREVGALVRETLFGSPGFARPAVEVASYFIGAIVVYATISIAGWLTIRMMRAATPSLATIDRLGGALLGGVKGGAIVYVMIVGFALLAIPLKSQDPDDRLHLRDSVLYALGQQYDLFAPWRFADLDRVKKLLVAGQEAPRTAASNHPEVYDLVRAKGVRELVNDPELREALDAGDDVKLFADERVRALLNDRDFVERLRRADFEALEKWLAERLSK